MYCAVYMFSRVAFCFVASLLCHDEEHTCKYLRVSTTTVLSAGVLLHVWRPAPPVHTHTHTQDKHENHHLDPTKARDFMTVRTGAKNVFHRENPPREKASDSKVTRTKEKYEVMQRRAQTKCGKRRETVAALKKKCKKKHEEVTATNLKKVQDRGKQASFNWVPLWSGVQCRHSRKVKVYPGVPKHPI